MEIRGYRVTARARFLIIQFLICSLGLTLGISWKAYSENKKWSNLFYPGVMVYGIDLGGKTKEEATKLVKSKCLDLLAKGKINIHSNNKVYTMELSNFISEFDVNSTIDEAFNLRKNTSFLKKHLNRRKDVVENNDITIKYNESYIKEFISSMERDINRKPINSSIEKVHNSEIRIKEDVKGLVLEGEKLEECIKNKVSSESDYIISIKAPIKEVTASLTKEELSSVDQEISSFSTSFVSSSAERVKNIKLAVKSIDGKVLMPGEVFSFNDIVGERIKERGFLEAPVILNGKIDSGLGGGICQVSSTLYNAVLRTGIKPIERTNHSLPSSYVALGLDATVAWNSKDFKFENTLDYPLFIEGYTDGKNLHINLYSNSNLVRKKYEISSNVYEKIKSKTKTVDDPKLPKGKITILQKGYDGYRVKVTRNTYENGVLINSEVISNDFYLPVTSVIKRGVGSSY
jgi:vancomycin resistance protein YoaR